MGVRAFSPEEIQKAYDESREIRTADYNRFTLRVGKMTPERNVIRIMPRHEDQEKLFLRIRTHFGLGPYIGTAWEALPKDVKRTSAPCLEQFGEPCPLCALIPQTWNQAKAARTEHERLQAENVARGLKAKERFGFLLVDDLDPSAGVQEYWINVDLYQRILACFRDDKGKTRDLTDPVTGRNIIIEASKKKGTNWDQYDVVRAFDEPTPLQNWDRLEPQIYNMEAIHLYKPTPEQLLDALKTGDKIQRGHQPGVAVSSGTMRAFPFQTATSGVEAAKLVGSGRSADQEEGAKPPAPTAGVPRKAPGPAKRKAPVEKAAAPTTDPWLRGRQWLATQGVGQGFTQFTVLQEMTPAQFEVVKTSGELDDVPCFTTADPQAEAICRGCKVLLVCSTHKVAAGNV
jgi:gp32 DNA binding protein like